MSKKLIFGIISAVFLLVFLLSFQNFESKPPEDYSSIGTKHSVQKLLSNPNLIGIKDIEDEKYIQLFSDGEGREYSCATLTIEKKSKRYQELSKKITTVLDFWI